MVATNKKTGFTLTELAMAIAFFSILLLTIAAVTINLAKNYHKGSTLKSINTIGLGLIDEFSSAVSESPIFDIESLCKSLGDGYDECIDTKAEFFIHQQFKANITKTKNDGVSDNLELPVSGVFCTGKYSYVWNTGYILSKNDTQHSMTSYFYSGDTDPLDNGFRLRKYHDTGRTFCIRNFLDDPTDPSKKAYPDDYPENHLEDTMSGRVAISSELINASDIAIYSMTINPPTVNEQSGRSLYTGSFVLGSITGDIEINGNSSGCSLENVSSFDVEYCATNKFNFAMRAMGGNSGN